MSRGTRLVSVFRNVNAKMRLVYAVDGFIVAQIDPYLETRYWWGSDPGQVVALARDGLVPQGDGLAFRLEQLYEALFVLAERLTGVRIQPAWFEQPHRAVRIAAVGAP